MRAAEHTNTPRHCTSGASFFICIFRFFLRGLPDRAANFPARIRSKLESTGYIRHFASLKNKDVNWDVSRIKYFIGGDNLPVHFLSPPPSKKPKTSSS